MAIRISSDLNELTHEVTLKIEGALNDAGSDLLKQIYADTRKESAGQILIDLSGLTFVNSVGGRFFGV